MDRRRTALVLLLAFLACIGVAVVVSGSRPGPQQGIAPTVAAFVGYLFAFVAAVLLIAPGQRPPAALGRSGSRCSLLWWSSCCWTSSSRTGPNTGAGLVQLISEVVILVATVRLALGVGRAGRTG